MIEKAGRKFTPEVIFKLKELIKNPNVPLNVKKEAKELFYSYTTNTTRFDDGDSNATYIGQYEKTSVRFGLCWG